MENDLRVLILAAGKSTRMKSKYPKVLHRVGGRTLIEHVVGAVRELSPDIAVVVGHSADRVKAAISDVTFIDQEEQLGTGHAVLTARPHFSGYAGDVLVMPGDAPLVRTEALAEFVRFHREGGFRACILTAEIEDPSGYGRIVRGNDSAVDSIVEHRDATPEVRKIREINSGIYVFNAPALFESLTKIRNTNAQREYYLTDVIGILVGQKQKVGASKIMSPEEVLGINTRQELAAVDRVMRRRKCEALMADGVTLMDPETTYIDASVKIGADTIIYPSVQIYGDTVIGEDVTIHSFSRILNSKLGDRTVVLEGSMIANTAIGEGASVGPYANLHSGTTLGNSAQVGNFVEIKKSSLGTGAKSKHLAYLGDATIGNNVNIGAGVITCNYDGVNKHPTIVEDGAFVGTDSQLIAPVRIGKGAYVAAGSSITEDVPPESLAVARGRQVIKEGWVKNRKKK
jgi:bifunctional UDP-N-acetylglucosamine pyrophosphorylase/glucosamine-1-phosphate N-acetyltransferase